MNESSFIRHVLQHNHLQPNTIVTELSHRMTVLCKQLQFKQANKSIGQNESRHMVKNWKVVFHHLHSDLGTYNKQM